MFAPVAFIHVLQHALAIPVREVDVDIGSLLSLLGQKSLEQQPHANGIDRRDPQAIAHRRVGRRAASLTENAFASRKTDDVPDDEKESRHLERGDHAQLVRQLRALLRLVLASPALMGPLIDQSREILISGNPWR